MIITSNDKTIYKKPSPIHSIHTHSALTTWERIILSNHLFGCQLCHYNCRFLHQNCKRNCLSKSWCKVMHVGLNHHEHTHEGVLINNKPIYHLCQTIQEIPTNPHLESLDCIPHCATNDDDECKKSTMMPKLLFLPFHMFPWAYFTACRCPLHFLPCWNQNSGASEWGDGGLIDVSIHARKQIWILIDNEDPIETGYLQRSMGVICHGYFHLLLMILYK